MSALNGRVWVSILWLPFCPVCVDRSFQGFHTRSNTKGVAVNRYFLFIYLFITSFYSVSGMDIGINKNDIRTSYTAHKRDYIRPRATMV